MAQQDMRQQAQCYWLATPLVPAGTVVGACAGRFRHSEATDVVLNESSELHVLGVAPDGRLVTLFRQPVLCPVRDLQVLPFSSSSRSNRGSSDSASIRKNADGKEEVSDCGTKAPKACFTGCITLS